MYVRFSLSVEYAGAIDEIIAVPLHQDAPFRLYYLQFVSFNST